MDIILAVYIFLLLYNNIFNHFVCMCIHDMACYATCLCLCVHVSWCKYGRQPCRRVNSGKTSLGMTLCAYGGVIIQSQVLRVGQINIAIATYLPCCGFSYWVIAMDYTRKGQ